jgi:hypothetical protein
MAVPEGFGEDSVGGGGVVTVEVNEPGEDESSEERIGLSRLAGIGDCGRAQPLSLVEVDATYVTGLSLEVLRIEPGPTSRHRRWVPEVPCRAHLG